MGGLERIGRGRFAFTIALLGAFVSRDATPTMRATAGQTQMQPSFRVDVRLVEVDVVVTDADGQPVRDLTQEDFQVFEDGRVQDVATFSLVNLPIERAEPLSGESAAFRSDVQSNVQRADRRIYVLLLDDLHTAGSRGALVKIAARQFVEHNLGPGDVAAVVHVGAGAAAGQDFTSDRTRLLSSIERFVGRKLPSETVNRIESYNREVLFADPNRNPSGASRQGQDTDRWSRADDAAQTLEALRGLARGLGSLHGLRKAILWFGEGIGTDLFATSISTHMDPPKAGDSPVLSQARERSRDLYAAAARGNVAIYGIDARGLRGLGDEFVRIGSVPMDPAAGLEPGSNTGRIGPPALASEVRREQDNLRTVSSETGGFAVVNAGDFAPAFTRIVEDSSAYYLLGYYPTNERQDGSFRRLRVRVGRPGLVVRARQGYVAGRGTDSVGGGTTPGSDQDLDARLQAAIASPLAEGALPMAAQLVPLPEAGAKSSVLLTVQYGAAGFLAAANAAATDRLDTSLVVVDAAGQTVAADRTTIPLEATAETRSTIEALGFRTVSRLELPPGHYEVRIATVASASGKLGSLRSDLEVPDLATTALTLSPILVTSPLTARIPTAGRDVKLPATLSGPPTTVRAFDPSDVLTVYVQAFEGSRKDAHPVEVVTTVRTEDGREVLTGRQEHAAGRTDEMPRAMPFTSRIPLDSLPAGVYVLRLEATSGEGTTGTHAARELPFVVLPEQ